MVFIWENIKPSLWISAQSSKSIINREIFVLNFICHNLKYNHIFYRRILQQINLYNNNNNKPQNKEEEEEYDFYSTWWKHNDLVKNDVGIKDEDGGRGSAEKSRGILAQLALKHTTVNIISEVMFSDNLHGRIKCIRN